MHVATEMLKLLVELHPWAMYNLPGTLVSKTLTFDRLRGASTY